MSRNRIVKPIVYTNTSLWLLAQGATTYEEIRNRFMSVNSEWLTTAGYGDTGLSTLPSLGKALMRPNLYNMRTNDMCWTRYSDISNDMTWLNTNSDVAVGEWTVELPLPGSPDATGETMDGLWDCVFVLNHNFNRSWLGNGTANRGTIRISGMGGDGNYDDQCINNILNHADTLPANLHDGWSLTKGTATVNDNAWAGLELSFFSDHDASPMPWEATVYPFLTIGSAFCAQSYEFTRSPDMEMTVEYVYDGIKNTLGAGGASFTSKGYSRKPSWGVLAPFELGLGHSDDDVIATWNNAKLSQSGRRKFKLNFSYFPEADVFPGWNSQFTPSESGETVTVLDSNGTDYDNYVNPGLQDSSLYTQFINRTLGGTIPFIIRLDSDASTPQHNPANWAIVTLDQKSLSFKQVSQGFFEVSMSLTEVW